MLTEDEQDFDGIEAMSTPADFDPDGDEALNESAEFSDAKAEVNPVDGLEAAQDLNKNTFSYTPGQCARISSGTQNYCIFAGSGR